MDMIFNDKHNTYEDEESSLDVVNSFKNLSSWRFCVELLKWVFTGLFMGTSDAIPGYSGGTTLALLGFFRRLVLIAKSVFVPEPGITRLRAFTFMLPFSLGWIAGVFGFAKVTELMASHGLGLELLFFFVFFVIFAIPMFLRNNNPNLHKKDKGLVIRWGFFFFGFFSILSLALIIFFVVGGASFHGARQNIEGQTKYQLEHKWWQLILVAFFAGMITIIPGGSGAIIQLLGSHYDQIHWTILGHPIINIWALIIFAISTFSGMVATIFLFSWLLKKHHKIMSALSFGMLLASIAAILLVPEKNLWSNMHDHKHIIGVIVAGLLGIFTGLFVNIFVIYTKNRKSIKQN